jgi:transposase
MERVMKTARPIELSSKQRIELERMVRSQTLEVRAVRRAQIVLLAADGMGNREIAAALGIGRVQVGRWRERFVQGGVAAIEDDLPRSGRKPRVDRAEIVRLTTQTTPEAATHWSTRTLARKAGVSDTTVLRIWQANGLKPHLIESFKVSRDPKFAEKLEDIVGLYMPRPSMRWFCAATRRARCRHSTAPSPDCP